MQIKPNIKSVAPRYRPIHKVWLKVLDSVVRVLSFGSACVVSIEKVRPIRWNGVIKSEQE